jgi:hypothetical protein
MSISTSHVCAYMHLCMCVLSTTIHLCTTH